MTNLIGQWRLLSWIRIANGEVITYPLGEDASGILVYAPDGRMAVQIVAARRPRLETTDPPLGGDTEARAAAYSTQLAYFGSYEVRDGQVVHRIEGSSFPNWSNTEQVRPFTFDGETLVLRTPPGTTGSATVVNEISWVRA